MNISAFNKFLQFLRNGSPVLDNLSIKEKIFVLIKLYFYLILFSFFINLISSLLFNDPLPAGSLSVEPDNYYLIFALFLIIPIYEEITFRLFLTRFEKTRFIISISFLTSYSVYWVFYDHLALSISYSNQIMPYAFLILLAVLIAIPLFLLTKKVTFKLIKMVWNNNFLIIFYTTSFLFALLHFKKEIFSVNGILGELVYLTPLLLSSFMLGFIRINFGLFYSVLFHLFLNFPTILIRYSLS